MANPEHVTIVRAGAKTIAKWTRGQLAMGKTPCLDLRGAKLKNCILSKANLARALLNDANLAYAVLKNADLSFANMKHANLMCANLRGAVCYNATFESATLIGADLRGARLLKADFSYARLLRAKLNSAIASDTNFYAAILHDANLTCTILCNSNLSHTDFTGAYLRRTNLCGAQLIESELSNADLSGLWLYGTQTDNWKINKVRCTYFFIGSEQERIPVTGTLAPGEFEDRFMSRPTIEFIFKEGMTALSPAALGLAIDSANSEKPEARLRLLDITSRGGIPRAIIEVAEKVPKAEALKLIQVCYEQKVKQLNAEISALRQDKEALLQITAHKMLLPALASHPEHMTVGELAKHFQIENKEALRKRLERFRKANAMNANAFIESQDRGPRKAKFLYNIEMVRTIGQDLKKKEMSAKRPTKKKRKKI